MKRKFAIMVAAVTTTLMGQGAVAQDGRFDIWTGNGFLQTCRDQINVENAFRIGMCFGYLDGWLSRDAASMEDRSVCRPKNVPNRQLMDIILKYLENNPEKRHLMIDYAIHGSLSQAFPCSTGE